MEKVRCWYCSRDAVVTKKDGTKRYIIYCPCSRPYSKTQKELDLQRSKFVFSHQNERCG